LGATCLKKASTGAALHGGVGTRGIGLLRGELSHPLGLIKGKKRGRESKGSRASGGAENIKKSKKGRKTRVCA